jgi:hypothetical protein
MLNNQFLPLPGKKFAFPYFLPAPANPSARRPRGVMEEYQNFNL